MMETPTSDFASNGSFEPSEPSTPGTPIEQFEPLFRVKVTEPVKDGELLKYTIKSSRLDEKEAEYKVVRDFEDFEWLQHCILTQNDVMGLIVPPLPYKPPVEPKSTESKSKQKLGSSSKVIIGDEFHKDCRGLERYLTLVLAHPVLGRDKTMEQFLTHNEAMTKAKIRKGLFGSLSASIELNRKANHKDIDDYFQDERDKALSRAALTKATNVAFSKMTNSEQRIAHAYDHLAVTLKMGGGYQDEYSQQYNKLLVRMSEALDDAKHGAEVGVTNDERTLGFQLDLASRYSDALKEMLYRRTCLLVDYQEANKALDKAKPQKKAAAEDLKIQAERSYEECTETARRELQAHHRQRLLMMQSGLVTFAEAKIKTARDTYALLAKSLSSFKTMSL